jgi:hypothetical protein
MQGSGTSPVSTGQFDPDQFKQEIVNEVQQLLNAFALQYQQPASFGRPLGQPIFWPIYFYLSPVAPTERPEQQRFRERMREFWKSLLDEIEGDQS